MIKNFYYLFLLLKYYYRSYFVLYSLYEFRALLSVMRSVRNSTYAWCNNKEKDSYGGPLAWPFRAAPVRPSASVIPWQPKIRIKQAENNDKIVLTRINGFPLLWAALFSAWHRTDLYIKTLDFRAYIWTKNINKDGGFTAESWENTFPHLSLSSVSGFFLPSFRQVTIVCPPPKVI